MRLDDLDPSDNARDLGSGGGGGGLGGGGGNILLGLLPMLLGGRLGCGTLALLGIEVPRSLDGVPMQDLLSCDVGWTDALPARPAIPGTGSGEGAESLEDRLRKIGYLGP